MLLVGVASYSLVLAPEAATQTITEIIDETGDGTGNPLDAAAGLAVDGTSNVYVTGLDSHNAFKITPGGVITEIIDATGDGAGNGLTMPVDVAVDGPGNVYVTGFFSSNAFVISPSGAITKIIDGTGDGGGNPLSAADCIAVDMTGRVYVAGRNSDNAFKISGLVDVGDEPTIAVRPLHVWPNPFRGSVNVSLGVPASTSVDISVFDLAGRLIRFLHSEAPANVITWDGTTLAGTDATTGVYFIRLETGNRVEIRRVLLVR
jgi:hypothetical protein